MGCEGCNGTGCSPGRCVGGGVFQAQGRSLHFALYFFKSPFSHLEGLCSDKIILYPGWKCFEVGLKGALYLFTEGRARELPDNQR